MVCPPVIDIITCRHHTSNEATVYTATSLKRPDEPSPKLKWYQHTVVMHAKQTVCLIKAAMSGPTGIGLDSEAYLADIQAYFADIVISDQDIPGSQVTMYEALLG